MDVKTSGFVWDIVGVELREFLLYLREHRDDEFENRRLLIDQIEFENDEDQAEPNGFFDEEDEPQEMWGGYLINLREERAIPVASIEEEEIEIDLQTVGDETKHHAEFNFFLINLATGKGLFQSYARAARWTYFVKYIGHRFENFKVGRVGQRPTLRQTPLFTQGTFEQNIDQLEWIKEIQIEMSVHTVRDPWFRRLDDECSRKIEIFRFYRNSIWDLRNIQRAARRIFQTEAAADMKVTGTVGGVEAVYTFTNDVEVFFTQEYEEYIRRLRSDAVALDDCVNNSRTIRDLLEIYNETLETTRIDQIEL
ncbi:MAG TPA: hypothetical protein VK612_13055 [Pyrinomonadaceae bacterium]|nr:hypothetical protein [Pyrinomonadaceae bacterium]